MHVHPNQINPYAELDAMYAAQKAAGRRAAERTRRKLLEFASALSGEADCEACVIELQEGAGSQEEPEKNQQRGPAEKQMHEGNGKKFVSDWV